MHGNKPDKFSPETNHEESAKPQTNNVNPFKPTIQEINAKQEDKARKVSDRLHPFEEPVANGLPRDLWPNMPNYNPSFMEMWNLIESVGIKRESVHRVLTTPEAFTELYRMIYKRLHYEREQEMIKRLKTYVEKLETQKIVSKQKIRN